MKKIASIFCIMLIMLSTTPVTSGCFVFADTVPSGYSPCGVSDQVDAFRSYCYSRNIAIEGSLLDAVTSVTSHVYQSAIKSLGLDLNELQNQIYKNTSNNLGAKWFFTTTGISAFNRIFAEVLQNYNLNVGDSANEQDNTIYSGDYIKDSNGNSCLVYIIKQTSGLSDNPIGTNNAISANQIKYFGTSFIYDSTYIMNQIDSNGGHGFFVSTNILNSNLQPIRFSISGGGYQVLGFVNDYFGNYFASKISRNNVQPCTGEIAIYRIEGSNYYHVCGHGVNQDGTHLFRIPTSNVSGQTQTRFQLTDNTGSNVNVYFNTNNKTINNNNYEGDTYITNEGDVINYYPDPDPPTYEPYPDGGGTVTDPITPQNPSEPDQNTDINVNFPDIDLNLPEINWSIGDLSHKFPFSIPFDLYSMFSVLNVPPETPEIKGNIDLGIYQWSIDWDFHQFDGTANLLRNIEFVGFVIGLIFITRNIIKG